MKVALPRKYNPRKARNEIRTTNKWEKLVSWGTFAAEKWGTTRVMSGDFWPEDTRQRRVKMYVNTVLASVWCALCIDSHAIFRDGCNCSSHAESDPATELWKWQQIIQSDKVFLSTLFMFSGIQSNLFNTDTKGTELSVRFTEVAVL